MKTFSSALLISIFSGIFTTHIHAEKITFSGSIAEFSCSKDSIDAECKNVVNTVERIKSSKSSLNMAQIINSADKKTANYSIQNIDNKDKKVLTVNYF